MENTQEINISNILDDCSQMRILLIEQQKNRSSSCKVFLFPNDATNEALPDYKNNFKNYVSGRDIVDYSQTEIKKETIQKLPITELSQWNEIKVQIDNMPVVSAPIFKPSDLSKNIRMVIIECLDSEGNVCAFLISKFAYNSAYSKKIRFFFAGNTYEKIKHPVLTLGDSIDCFIYNDSVYILLESRFDSLFDFHKRIKDEVNSRIGEIESWDFFDNNDISNEITTKIRKSRQFLRVVNSASLSAWKTKTPTERKQFIQADAKLRDKFQFDEQDHIVFSKEALSELFKLLTNDYYINLLTGETEER